MSTRTIYITERDMEKLRKLLMDERDRHGYRNGRGEHLKGLEAELDRSTCVADDKVPRDVITMHSTARLVDLETGEELVYTLVFPHEADVGQGKISVLAPIGTAMLGYRAGDVIEWQVPDGLRRLQVKEVLYQPEAEGASA
ncbi:MAG: nucleoside diphosphate kinase regulator [Chloroflexota bacterium]|nr:MAG: nucleoside diphosphate kinase regulator [Chloroflexota bacterium]